jgi:hypothetical protein
VRCAFCDKPLTASVSKGRGGQYAYYHCMKKNHVRVRAEKLEADWLALLDPTQPKPDKEHAVLGIFQQEWEAANASSESATAVKAIRNGSSNWSAKGQAAARYAGGQFGR